MKRNSLLLEIPFVNTSSTDKLEILRKNKEATPLLAESSDFASQKKEGYIMEYKFTADNFQAEVMESSIPVLVDFYADWCGPCKMMGPIVKALAEKYDGKVKVGKINVDEQPTLAQQYKVMSIPTFVIFKDGKAAGTFVGGMSQKDLEAKVEQVLS